jgi:hypothetical protein
MTLYGLTAFFLNLSGSVCRVIFFPAVKYYVEGLTCIVHVTDSTFTPKLTPSGLTQGNVLSTTLFSLRLSDMSRPPHTHLPLYAEVTAILSQSWQPDNIFRILNQSVTNLLKYSLNEHPD